MEFLFGSRSDVPECLAIARTLREHFNAAGLKAMERDLPGQSLHLAKDASRTVGFASVRVESPAVAELAWMAVRANVQGWGVGTGLVEHLVSQLRTAGVKLLTVRTLAPTVDYPPYERTRRFYEKCGFHPVQIIDPYPEWGEGNPCLLSVRVV